MVSCPECGAAWLEPDACQNAFYQMLNWESEDPQRGEVHHLTVLCYHLQHPSKLSPEGLAGMIELLFAFIEKGIAPQEVRRQNRHRLDSRQRRWKIRAAGNRVGAYRQPFHWTMTASDVLEGGAENYCSSVRRWAQAIYAEIQQAGGAGAVITD